MMQEQANDPNRLWQNRGGQLLKEEKERKVIQKVNTINFLFNYKIIIVTTNQCVIFRNYPRFKRNSKIYYKLMNKKKVNYSCTGMKGY